MVEAGEAAPRRLAVAVSGGRDSTALLHAVWRALGRTTSDVELHALHVHHGLSSEADDWAAHVRGCCARWSRRGIPIRCHVRRLSLQPVSGESLEAQARRGRYAALADMARGIGCTTILLAHHQDDQAETFLLQALRGGGVAGLAAMPVRAERDGMVWMRPWLHLPRRAVESYIRRHRLTYVDDDSNADTGLARNRLRLDVWPSLHAAFPKVGQVLATSARHAHDAAVCQEALARLDLQQVGDAQALSLEALQRLGAERMRNLLRHWLPMRCGAGSLAASLIERVVAELDPSRNGQCWPARGGWVLRTHAGRLLAVPVRTIQSGSSVQVAEPFSVLRPGCYRPAQWRGNLHVRSVDTGGVALAKLASATLRSRVGGEQFQRTAQGCIRSLKKQYQAAGVPAWMRAGPLVFDAKGQLLFVPGLGLDARCLANPGEPQVALAWSGIGGTEADGSPQRGSG